MGGTQDQITRLFKNKDYDEPECKIKDKTVIIKISIEL